MTYVGWRVKDDNERKYIKMAEGGDLYAYPMFKNGSLAPEDLDEIGNRIADSIMENPDVTLTTFICAFTEYLHEEHGLGEIDCEVFIQTCTLLLAKHLAQTTIAAIQETHEMMSNTGKQ